MAALELNPWRSIFLSAKYDIDRGYWPMRMAAVSQANIMPPEDYQLDGLDRYGWKLLAPLVDPESFLGPEEYDIDQATDVLEAVIPQLEERLRLWFGSEFMPICVMPVKTEPGEGNASMFWHCDAGPTGHLKALIYLNETDAGTLVMDRADSDLYRRIGYQYGALESRLENLSALATRFQLPNKVYKLSPPPGSGLIFEPGAVLHRGLPPTDGVREHIQIVFVPSTASWREKWAEMGRDLVGNTGAGFPECVRV